MPIMMNNSSYMNNIKTLYHFRELLSRLIWATTRKDLTPRLSGALEKS